MVILAPDGKALAARVVQPMTHDQISWFLDPVALLNGAPHLWTLKLRLYCQRCFKCDLDDDVKIEWHETHGAWSARCACAKIAGKLPKEAVVRYASTADELLQKLGWSFCCIGRCASEEGMSDGVEALNDVTSNVLTVNCGCTERRYQMAAA